jgi:hypothetical protein
MATSPTYSLRRQRDLILASLLVLAAITLLIFAEKSLPRGPRIGQVGALALIAYGLVAVLAPQVLPTMQGHGRMGM